MFSETDEAGGGGTRNRWSEDQRRAWTRRNRRLLRETVKSEIHDRPLTWLRRRELVQYFVGLGMDPFEARLLIRAVEYECGHAAPAAMAEFESPHEDAYVVEPPPTFARLVTAVLVVTTTLVGIFLIQR